MPRRATLSSTPGARARGGKPRRMRGRPSSYHRFKPAWALRDAQLQTVLSGSSAYQHVTRWRCRAALRDTETWLLDCGEGISLRGLYDRSPASRGMVTILHGWLGNAESAYVQSTTATLRRAGFSVFRLNFRDHGNTEHLNRTLFRSTQLREVIEAVRQAQQRALFSRCALVGFSLGGNFALRIGAGRTQHNLDISRVVAICPPLNPKHAAERIEASIYHRYFVRRWQSMLRRKLGYFPGLGYSKNDFLGLKTLHEMNHYFIEHHTEYPDLDTYYRAYTLTGSALSGLATDSHVIVSRDDPVIPYGDAKTVARTPALTIEHTRFGGHCGYLSGLSLRSWLPGRILRLLSVDGATDADAGALALTDRDDAPATDTDGAIDAPSAP